MAIAFSLSDPLFVYAIIGGIVIVLVLLFALYLKKKRQAGSSDEKSAGSKAGRLAYQPEARPVRAQGRGDWPVQVRESVQPVPRSSRRILSRAGVPRRTRCRMPYTVSLQRIGFISFGMRGTMLGIVTSKNGMDQ